MSGPQHPTAPPTEADESTLTFEEQIAELGEEPARLEQIRRLLEAQRRG
jgi:hypothetical protein